MGPCYAGTEKTPQKACRSHKEDKGRDFSAPWGYFIPQDSNIWGRFLLEKCKLYCFIFPPFTWQRKDMIGVEMKSRMNRQSNRLLDRARTAERCIDQTPACDDQLRDIQFTTVFRPVHSFPPLQTLLFSLCSRPPLFHAKANMSRRNRFSRWLWSCCYDSFICLSHILLSAAVTPQHASN